MKKNISLLSFLFIFCSMNAQVTRADLEKAKPAQVMKEMDAKGYKMENGWTVHVGDTVYFGKGTLPTKHYAYIYESMTSWSNILGGNQEGNDAMNGRVSLKSQAATRSTIKKLIVYGSKKGGYTAIAVVGLGEAANYWIELENAVDEGELKAPKEFQKGEQSEESGGSSKIDKLKDLKKLLDDGALTQEEYDAEKKKVLNEK